MKFGFYDQFKCTGTLDIEEVVEVVRTGIVNEIDFSSLIEKIRAVDKVERDTLKKQLPAISTSGTFKDGKRRNENIEFYSQVVQVDIDDTDQIERIEREIKSDPFIMMGFRSPSSTGFKILIQVDSSVEDHVDACWHVHNYIEDNYKVVVDRSVKDIARLMFLSYDPFCYSNTEAQLFRIQEIIDLPIRGAGIDKMHLKQLASVDREVFNQIQDIHLNLQNSSVYKPGNRNIHVHKFASRLNYFGIEREVAEQVIYSNFDLSQKELDDCIQSAYKRTGKFGLGCQTATSATSQNVAGDISCPTVEQFVYDNLPDFIRETANAFTNHQERDIFLIPFLTITSGVLDSVHGLYGGHRVYPNLYCFLSAPPASSKGTAKFAKQVGSQYDQHLYNESMQRIDAWESEEEEKRGERPPLQTLYIPGNASYAAFVNCLRANGGKGVMMETESDTLASSTEQSWGDFSHLLRQAYHHEDVLLTRIEGTIRMSEPKLSIVLTGTPGQLRRLVKSTENGLFSRFIFYVFKSDAGWIDQFSSEKTQYHSMISRMSLRFSNFVEHSQIHPFEFHFSKEQQQRHTAFFTGLVESFDEYEVDRAAINRLGLVCFRLGMILTAMRRYDSKDLSRKVICTDIDFEVALNLCNTFYEHSQCAFKLLIANKSRPALAKEVSVLTAIDILSWSNELLPPLC